jgi:hypothetical protein
MIFLNEALGPQGFLKTKAPSLKIPSLKILTARDFYSHNILRND